MLKRLNKKKSIILIFSCILLLTVIVSGTIAWFKSESNSLVSKFSYGNIKIFITEEDVNDENVKNFEIIPGAKIKKNTTVTVEENSEDCWLFIEIEQSDNFYNFMNYSIEAGWKKLEEYENIYYREVDKKNEKQIYAVFKDDIINVNSDITRELFNSLTDDNYPMISILAYGIQRNSKIDAIDTAEDAWLLVNNQNN